MLSALNQLRAVFAGMTLQQAQQMELCNMGDHYAPAQYDAVGNHIVLDGNHIDLFDDNCNLIERK